MDKRKGLFAAVKRWGPTTKFTVFLSLFSVLIGLVALIYSLYTGPSKTNQEKLIVNQNAGLSTLQREIKDLKNLVVKIGSNNQEVLSKDFPEGFSTFGILGELIIPGFDPPQTEIDWRDSAIEEIRQTSIKISLPEILFFPNTNKALLFRKNIVSLRKSVSAVQNLGVRVHEYALGARVLATTPNIVVALGLTRLPTLEKANYTNKGSRGQTP